jgi:class 3 adenylate cyclase
LLKQLITAACIAAIVGAICGLVMAFAGPVANLEARSGDWRFMTREEEGEKSEDIVLILVTEEAELPYRSPIPRDHLAAVIEKLGPARLIGLDIFFDRHYGDSDGDLRLKNAIEAHGGVVAVSMIDRVQDKSSELSPLPYFADAMLDVGYARLAAGDAEEETIREGTIALGGLSGGRALSLAGALYAAHLGRNTASLRQGDAEAQLGGMPLEGNFLINYSGPPNIVYQEAEKNDVKLPGGFTMFASHQMAVMPDAFFETLFKDKIVLIGTGLDDAPDRFRTPFYRKYPQFGLGYEKMLGVEIHAHALQTLLNGKAPTVWGGVWVMGLSVMMALVAAFVVLRLHTLSGMGILLVLLSGLWVGGFAVFSLYNNMMPLILPSLGLLLSFGLATAYQARTEGRDRRQTRQLFERYLAPAVVEELLDDPSLWTLAGKRMDITVMFADLEGFTPVSEVLSPEELVKLINEFLTEMTAIILAEGGTIDKYEGDLIMAFFGAPIPQDDHARRACRTALRMQAQMRKLRREWSRRGLPELRVRVGLHSGPAIVGNMGSEFRFNYTAMGDTVNLASRLEEHNKEYGTYVMLSRATRDMAGVDAFAFRDLGVTQVKGKKEMIDIYELVVDES